MKFTPSLRQANVASAALKERVRRPAYLKKLAQPADLAPLFVVRAWLVSKIYRR